MGERKGRLLPVETQDEGDILVGSSDLSNPSTLRIDTLEDSVAQRIRVLEDNIEKLSQKGAFCGYL